MYGVFINADETHPVENIRIENCTFNGVEKGNSLTGYRSLLFKGVSVNGKVVTGE
jgi:hypothetical protein